MMWQSLPRIYPLLGLFGGYAVVMLFNPVRQALRDGFRCLMRFPRVWLTFIVFGLAYSVFEFATFTPVRSSSDLDLSQIASLTNWYWPAFSDIWAKAPLPTLEGMAGLFDAATTTYPLSVIAALFIIFNWRGLHGALLRALRKQFGWAGLIIYLITLVSALATLAKPIIFACLPNTPTAGVLQISASVDAVAFIFEYFFGIYIQVYLIVVCFAWIRGFSFEEGELARFAMRRFTYTLKWAGVVVILSTLIVRVPMLLAYFTEVPNVLDYLPVQRFVMCILIIAFASVQISLALHNESLREAIRAHRGFMRRNGGLFGWFLLVAGLHFFLLMAIDALVRGAIADRLVAVLVWKCIFISVRGFITGWLLASWVCFFRQYERGRLEQESWIQY